MRALDLIPIILSVPRNPDYQRMSVEFRFVESSREQQRSQQYHFSS